MVWHWIFSITAGGLAGWSLARWSHPASEQPAQGDLLRGVLSLAAIIGFTYNGWMLGLTAGLATLGACVAAAALAYGAGRLRTTQIAMQAADDATEPDAPAAGLDE
jgi:hypothetical protein